MKSRAGFTLIEVLFSLLLLLMVGTMVNGFLVAQQIASLKHTKAATIQQILKRNIAEIKGTALSAFPAPGNCLVRYYDATGSFLNERADLLGSSECTDLYSNTAGEIKTTIQFRTATPTSLTFSPAAFLKLPSANPVSIVEIKLQGTYSSRETRYLPIDITLYRGG